jgi:hypothetical protein
MRSLLLFKNRAHPITGIFLFFAILFAASIFLPSCQKKYIGPEISYGTNFNLLLRMVVNSDAGVTTHTFTYDGNGLVASRNILLKGKNPSRTENSLEQYYRNASGSIDSIKVVSSLNGVVSSIKKLYFYYSYSTNVGYSVIVYNTNDANTTRDSSVYQYTGSFLIQRTDYTTTGSTPYSGTASRQLTYQYSGRNISNLIFQNTAQQQTTLISYNYDTSKAALPINGFQYAYSSVGFAYQEYAATNNLQIIKYGDGNSVEGASYTYTYLPIGKPYIATLTETSATGGKTVSTIQFFYD